MADPEFLFRFTDVKRCSSRRPGRIKPKTAGSDHIKSVSRFPTAVTFFALLTPCFADPAPVIHYAPAEKP